MPKFSERIRGFHEASSNDRIVHFVGRTSTHDVAILSKSFTASIEGGPDFYVLTTPIDRPRAASTFYRTANPNGRIWLPGALSIFAEPDRGAPLNVLVTFTPDAHGNPVPPLIDRELAIPAAESPVPVTPIPETEAALVALHAALRQTPPGAL
jgi:hypothetical protein